MYRAWSERSACSRRAGYRVHLAATYSKRTFQIRWCSREGYWRKSLSASWLISDPLSVPFYFPWQSWSSGKGWRRRKSFHTGCWLRSRSLWKYRYSRFPLCRSTDWWSVYRSRLSEPAPHAWSYSRHRRKESQWPYGCQNISGKQQFAAEVFLYNEYR